MVAEEFVGVIDQGTTSTRFMIFSANTGQVSAKSQEEVHIKHPHSGWSEIGGEEIISLIDKCVMTGLERFCAAGHSIQKIKCVGIANQRETTILWDRKTCVPLYNAILWSDTRSGEIVREFSLHPNAKDIQRICGLPLTTYASASKLIWMLRNVPKVSQAYEAGNLMFGTLDTWIIYRLTRGRAFITDVTNASRTMFMNLKTCMYDVQCMKFFEINPAKVHFPAISANASMTNFGVIAHGKLSGIPITGCIGDQSAALVGHFGFSPGSVKATYGTGCFVLLNIGTELTLPRHGLLATVAYDFGNLQIPRCYALEGSIAAAGSGVNFLMKNLKFGRDNDEISKLALSVSDSAGCTFVPAFSGLFAPYWIDDARGTLFGLTHSTQQGHIVRALFESIAFQTRAILHAMKETHHLPISALLVDGGLCASNICMQIQADLVHLPIHRPILHEITSFGTFITAGFGFGLWKSIDQVKSKIGINSPDNIESFDTFHPKMEDHFAHELCDRWRKAVKMSRGWLSHPSRG